MICTELKWETNGLIMVDIKRELDDRGFERIVVSTEKTEVDYIVSKAENGYSQYKVTVTKGNAPEELRGMYTTPDYAMKSVVKYLEKKRWSQAAKNRETAKRVEERKRKRNGSKLLPDGEEHVQQGSAY